MIFWPLLPIDHFEQRNIPITRLLISQKQQTLDPFKKYWLDILCMKSQLTVYDPTTNLDVPQKWLLEVDLTKMFSQYHHKVGKAKYAAKTPLEYWTLLQTEVPSSICLVHTTKTIDHQPGTVTESTILFPTLQECRNHFNSLITGIKLVWEDLDDKADDNFDQERTRIDPYLSTEEFRNPFPEDFFGFNIKQFVKENNYPNIHSKDWKWVDKNELKEKDLYEYKMTNLKFWSLNNN